MEQGWLYGLSARLFTLRRCAVVDHIGMVRYVKVCLILELLYGLIKTLLA